MLQDQQMAKGDGYRKLKRIEKAKSGCKDNEAPKKAERTESTTYNSRDESMCMYCGKGVHRGRDCSACVGDGLMKSVPPARESVTCPVVSSRLEKKHRYAVPTCIARSKMIRCY